MKVLYLCNDNACGGILCSTECNHTTDINFALHKDSLHNAVFRCIQDEGKNIIAFEEIERERVYHAVPKELTIWSIGGNKYELDKGCSMTLYNEDENGDEYDSVHINLKPDDIKMLIRCLQEYIKED